MAYVKKVAASMEAKVGESMSQEGSTNIGDYRLFRNRAGIVDRTSYGDVKQSRNVIFAGEAILADAPNRNFTYYWYCPFGGDRGSTEAELEGLLDEGWEVVKPVEIGGKWKVSDRFRRSPEGYVTWAGHILYALPAEIVERREAEEQRKANPKGQVLQSLGQFANDARGMATGGIRPYVKVNNETHDI